MLLATALALLPALPVLPAGAQSPTDEIARYREMLGDDNPADLWIARGEALWRERAGPRNVSLEKCDLGKGLGIVKGAYAALPRYFADTKRVMDLETRLVHCMTTLQGRSFDEVTRRPYGNGDSRSEFEALSAYIADQSRGLPVSVPLDNPAMRRTYALGQTLFYRRAGTHDFACATCHGESGRRIRLQELPKLAEPAEAQRILTTWPAYRVSQGEVRTMQWRMQDCMRQQRLPQLKFTSDAVVALITYLTHHADGGVMNAPGLKR